MFKKLNKNPKFPNCLQVKMNKSPKANNLDIDEKELEKLSLGFSSEINQETRTRRKKRVENKSKEETKLFECCSCYHRWDDREQNNVKKIK